MAIENFRSSCLQVVNDSRGDGIYEFCIGTAPVIINAPHAGWPNRSPAGAKAFDVRDIASRPANCGNINLSNDRAIQLIAYGVINYLLDYGIEPSVMINRVDRQYVDLNRSWACQGQWLGNVPSADYQQQYFQNYHDKLQDIVTRSDQGSWLFDLHGTSLASGDIAIGTGNGASASRQSVYDRVDSFFDQLINAGFTPFPSRPISNTAQISEAINANGIRSYTLFQYGADDMPDATGRIGLPGPGDIAVPPARRTHAVQLELDGSLRTPSSANGGWYNNPLDRQCLDMMRVGAQLGEAITQFLVAQRLVTIDAGRDIEAWYVIQS